MNNLKHSFREILRYPSAVLGLSIIFLLVVIAIYTLITIPYNTAINRWRGGEEVWDQNPKFAPPAWINFFLSKKLPVSFTVDTANHTMPKTVTPGAQGPGTVDISYSFDVTYDDYPQEMFLYFTTKYIQKQPFV